MNLTKKIVNEISNSRKINLILTGGSSPLKFYNQLFRQKINWKKVNLFLKDERLVNIYSKDSNYKNINSILSKNKLFNKLKPLDKNSTQKKNIKFINNSLKNYKTICFMGLGDDGHFASIFNNSKKYKELINLKKKPNILITDRVGKPFVKRATMNLSMLNCSSKFYLILSKKNKISLFEEILNSQDIKMYPILNLINLAKDRIYIFDGSNVIKLKKFHKYY
jgi:6-phosphogluconolactonase